MSRHLPHRAAAGTAFVCALALAAFAPGTSSAQTQIPTDLPTFQVATLLPSTIIPSGDECDDNGSTFLPTDVTIIPTDVSIFPTVITIFSSIIPTDFTVIPTIGGGGGRALPRIEEADDCGTINEDETYWREPVAGQLTQSTVTPSVVQNTQGQAHNVSKTEIHNIEETIIEGGGGGGGTTSPGTPPVTEQSTAVPAPAALPSLGKVTLSKPSSLASLLARGAAAGFNCTGPCSVVGSLYLTDLSAKASSKRSKRARIGGGAAALRAAGAGKLRAGGGKASRSKVRRARRAVVTLELRVVDAAGRAGATSRRTFTLTK